MKGDIILTEKQALIAINYKVDEIVYKLYPRNKKPIPEVGSRELRKFLNINKSNM